MNAQRVGRSAIVACCSLLLHVLMLAPFVPGLLPNARPRLPDARGLGASTIVSDAEAAATLILIDMPTDDGSEALKERLASRGPRLRELALIIVAPDPKPSFDEADTGADAMQSPAVSDAAHQAQMFGRYVGQVAARIDRTWARPRTPIGAERFECRVRIDQDRGGRVLLVELQNCNGDLRWQLSLVSAIEHAAPLPAPPVPSVFAGSLVLNFSADAWQPGASNVHDYEPEIRTGHLPVWNDIAPTSSGRK